MQAITDQEMRERLSAYPELKCEGKDVKFTSSHPEAQMIRVDCRVPEPHQIASLARLVAHLWFDERAFGGASLWITQWGVWSPDVESVGFTVLERMRQGWGEPRPVISAPGHIFREEQFVESVSCFVQPMLVGWDAYYIPQFAEPSLDYFLFLSHDSFLEIHTRTEKAHGQALSLLKSHDWIKIV
jgi:hypothetical protein